MNCAISFVKFLLNGNNYKATLVFSTEKGRVSRNMQGKWTCQQYPINGWHGVCRLPILSVFYQLFKFLE